MTVAELHSILRLARRCLHERELEPSCSCILELDPKRIDELKASVNALLHELDSNPMPCAIRLLRFVNED